MKEQIRKEYKIKRKKLKFKSQKDELIATNFLDSSLYLNSSKILIYYSKKEEINTLNIIKKALKDQKLVALPYCINDTIMQFYLIKNLTDIKVGNYGILEPDIQKCKLLNNYHNSICVVPGLCFNKQGYRVGYGKGYYDYFLKDYPGISIGLCYEEFLINKNFALEHDIPVNYICTENNLLPTNNLL